MPNRSNSQSHATDICSLEPIPLKVSIDKEGGWLTPDPQWHLQGPFLEAMAFNFGQHFVEIWLKWLSACSAQNEWPLSGNVTQFFRAIGDMQWGWLNYHLEGSSNADQERSILKQVSYGKELGKLMEVVAVMLKHNKGAEQGIEPGDRALYDFVDLYNKIKSTKGETPLDLNDVIPAANTPREIERGTGISRHTPPQPLDAASFTNLRV